MDEIPHRQDVLSECYNVQAYFDTTEPHNLLILEEYLVGAEDAYLNTLISTASPEHIRYHRVEDIISAAASRYELMEYQCQQLPLTYETAAEPQGSIQAQIETLPEWARRIMEPVIEGTKLHLKVKRGIFLFTVKAGKPGIV